MRSLSVTALIFCFGLSVAEANFGRRNSKIVLTNDDGWATAVLRATNDALKSSDYNVILSAPADNESGTSSSTAPPVPRVDPCEFDTCPAGSPAEGFNASDPRLNWVNSFPVDSVRFGIQTLAPKFFHSKPDFVVSGPNDGTNLGVNTVAGSGTVLRSSTGGHPLNRIFCKECPQISFTTLDNTTALTTIISRTYAALTLKYVNTFLELPGRILPPNITVNLHFPRDFTYIFTRLNASTIDRDVFHCGTDHLPDESTLINGPGCFVSITALNATSKLDVDAKIQASVLNRVRPIVRCLSSSA
ncbi:survival protein sure-like phosphatase/nucleotidase [Infundibulicybe gibba]|nr:survival protein sure-like phosphatase/nucleotidase [Infundibulicybe gibba]